MNRATNVVVVVGLCSAIAGATLLAQGSEPRQKTYLRIVQDVVKPGMTAEYERVQVARGALLASVNWPHASIGLRHFTGLVDQVWKLSVVDSYEEWESELNDLEKSPGLKAKLAVLEQQEAAVLQGRRVINTEYRPEVSYRGDFEWSDMRWFSIIAIHLRPGKGADYLANRALVRAAHTEAKLPENLALFAVSSGMLSGSWFVVRPVKAMKDFDAMKSMHGADYGKVLGDERRARLQAHFAASVETEEEAYFYVDPRLSYAPRGWAKTQAAFWTGGAK